MKFTNILAAVTWLLLTERRISYRRIARDFDLDDAALEDLRYQLIQVKRVAADQNGEFMVWASNAGQLSELQPAELTPPPALVTRSGQARQEVVSVQEVVAPEPTAETLSEVIAPPTSGSAIPAVEASDAERRPLTVMFCDLADSTALSTKLDPEDLQDVIRGYQERCTAIIREYDGFIAKYMGDGILVYFGYPKSLEKNAERAVRSGLAIVDAMATLNAELGQAKGIEIAVRIGIATGLVVVGEIVGDGLAQERTVIGEAPNIAARLQGLAARNGIVIGALTKEIAGANFLYDDLGSHELKGIPGRVTAWGVTGLRALDAEMVDQAETESEAAVVLIGRDEESGLLRRAWQSTKEENRGQVVMISGEAGIGKSGLIDGLRAEVRAEGSPWLTMRCSPYHISSAFHPIIEHFKRLAGWQPEDSVESRLAKLEAALEPYDQPIDETVPLLAALLSLPLPVDRYPPLAMTPQQQKRQTQDAIIAMTLAVTERQPLLELWEDVHWADPSTLELLGLLIEQAPTASLLMVLTARPEFVPPWPARSHITPITLNRLERQHSEALVNRLVGDKPLPTEVVGHIVAKTDGVPLYVEELTKTILASDILCDVGERYELIGPLSSLSIPETLQESLMARLDRLPKVRELAQLGSVLGREFAYEMISGLSTSGENTLQEGLGQLVESEMLYQRGRPPRAKYIFKHALIQDAAYQSLMRRARQQQHQQVAEFLEAKFPEVVEVQPELVAHHYCEANIADRAVAYLGKAGQRAVQRSANIEAIDHLQKGLSLLDTLPDPADRALHELSLRTTLGPALMAVKGQGAPETGQSFARARELGQQVGDTEQHFRAVWGCWRYHFVRSEHDHARQLGEQSLSLAEEAQDIPFILNACFALGGSLVFLGEFASAQENLERALPLYDFEQHRSLGFLYGQDPGASNLSYMSWILWFRGYPERARMRDQEALDLSEKLAHPLTSAFVRSYLAMSQTFRRDWPAVRQRADESIEISREHGFPQTLWLGTIMRGRALAVNGQLQEGIARMEEGVAARKAMAVNILLVCELTMLAEARGLAGQIEEGLQALSEAEEFANSSNEGFYLPEVHRVRGDLLLHQSQDRTASKAESAIRKALEIARRQKAKTLELRAATSLSRLWRDQGKPEQAHALLAPIYDWFSEGFETADLLDAKALLHDLSGNQVD